MRIWHKEMIQALPDKQLLGQWRELCAIASNINNKGTPNHLLVNKVTQFPGSHLYTYASMVFEELTKRGFSPNWQAFERHLQDKDQVHFVSFEDLFNTQDLHWHTPRYFWQCYYNLQEKLDCGGIKPMEWQAIYNLAVSYLKG